MTPELAGRVAAFDIAPTGPMAGEGGLRTQDVAAAIEAGILGRHEDLVRGLAANGLRQERRALVLRPAGLGAAWLAPDVLELQFSLKKGSYATVVIREIVSANLPDEQSD
jgi:tRNA pseudouridine13 synthase